MSAVSLSMYLSAEDDTTFSINYDNVTLIATSFTFSVDQAPIPGTSF